jgi:hypothetical protein
MSPFDSRSKEPIVTRERTNTACFNLQITPGMYIKRLSDLTQIKLIGEGANAQVFRAYFKHPSTSRTYIYAVKVANNKKVSVADVSLPKQSMCYYRWIL